ncbi:hypothetical protein ACFLSF_03385 [Candidatus Bipolaricaulota bacterium]
MRRVKQTVLVAVALTGIASLLLGTQTAFETLQFTGEFLNTPYGSLEDGEYCMRFEIFDAEAGGRKLWPVGDATEEHLSITVRQGRFEALLGSEGYPIAAPVDALPEVFVQVQVCRPAGPSCIEYEPLPLRMTLQTGGAASAAPAPVADEAPIIESTGPLAEVPIEGAGIGVAAIETLNDHTHWSETWTGSGIGLRLVSTDGGGSLAAFHGLSEVDAGIGLWGDSTGEQGHGGFFTAPQGVGLSVGRAGIDGIRVLAAGDDGLEIHDAGLAPSHLTTRDLELGVTSNGIDILGARDFGVWVGYAGRDGLVVGESQEHGLWVVGTGSDAIRVETTKGSGLSVAWAELTGVTIARAGTSGLVVNSAGIYGVYASSQGPAGVLGIAAAPSGRSIGVQGRCVSPEGFGVYSDGNAHVAGELTWQAKTSYVSVSPAAFRPVEKDLDYTSTGASLSWSRAMDIRGIEAFYAPVSLPHGAEVKRLELRMFSERPSGGAEDLRARSEPVTAVSLIRSDFADRLVTIAKVEEGGITAGSSEAFDTKAITEARIDNSRFTYFLVLRLPESFQRKHFLGAVVEYEVTEPY